VFKGITVTRDEVITALKAFASAYPEPNGYERWLEKDTYLYAIDYQGRLYPPKHILSVVTGIPTSEFSGGEQTNRVFRDLGFEIVSK